MNTALLSRLRQLFQHDLAPPHVARHNIKAWCRSRRFLKDKWLLAAPMEKPHA